MVNGKIFTSDGEYYIAFILVCIFYIEFALQFKQAVECMYGGHNNSNLLISLKSNS